MGIGSIVSHISGCSAEFEEAGVAPSGSGWGAQLSGRAGPMAETEG